MIKVGTVLILKDENQDVFVVNHIDKDGTVHFTNNLGTWGVVHRLDVDLHFTVKP